MQRRRHPAERTVIVVIITLLLALAAVAAWYVLSQRATTVAVGVGTKTFHVQRVHTAEKLTKGLGGVDSLPEDGGMLFDFGSDDTWKIWMKDMKIPIDVLWLSRDGSVVHLVQQMQPSSYPRQYYPYKKARYVLELPAGSVQRYSITRGMRVQLPEEAGR